MKQNFIAVITTCVWILRLFMYYFSFVILEVFFPEKIMFSLKNIKLSWLAS